MDIDEKLLELNQTFYILQGVKNHCGHLNETNYTKLKEDTSKRYDYYKKLMVETAIIIIAPLTLAYLNNKFGESRNITDYLYISSLFAMPFLIKNAPDMLRAKTLSDYVKGLE